MSDSTLKPIVCGAGGLPKGELPDEFEMELSDRSACSFAEFREAQAVMRAVVRELVRRGYEVSQWEDLSAMSVKFRASRVQR